MIDALPKLSPSQINTFRACQARWGFVYLLGLREPDSKYSARGKAVHKELEDYVLAGALPKDKLALVLLRHAVLPRHGVVERALDFVTDSSPWRGFVDLTYALRLGKPSAEIFDADDLVIQDWKTTTNMRNAKTVETLLNDTQTNLYAYEAFTVQGAKRVHGKWVYGTTCGAPQTQAVEFTFERSKVIDVVGEIDETAAQAQRLYQLRPKPTELPKNEGNCYAFGARCPHYETCRPDLKPKFSLKGAKVMSEAFKAAIPALPGKPAPSLPGKAAPALPGKPPPALPGKAAAPALPKKPVDINEKWANEHAPGIRGEEDVAPGEVDRGFVNPTSAPATAAATPEELAERQGITKPGAAAPDEFDAMTFDQLKFVTDKLSCSPSPRAREDSRRKALRAWAAENPERWASFKSGVEPQDVQEEYENSDRVEKILEEKSGMELWAEAEKRGELVEATVNGFTLFINCAPMSQEVLTLDKLLPALNLRMEREYQVNDYRLIDFGKGAAVLVAIYEELWIEAGAHSEDFHGDLVLDVRTPEGSVLANAISARAARVVRGF